MNNKHIVLRQRDNIQKTANDEFSSITTRKRQIQRTKILKNKNYVDSDEPLLKKTTEKLTFEYICNNPIILPESDVMTKEKWDNFYDQLFKRTECIRAHYVQKYHTDDSSKYPIWFIKDPERYDDTCNAFCMPKINDLLRNNEKKFSALGLNFLKNSLKFQPRFRYIFINLLVKWHLDFEMTSETLHLSVAIMDRFIKTIKSKLKDGDLTFIAPICLFMASKLEDIYPPELAAFIEKTNIKQYSKNDCRNLEYKILKSLNFNLLIPTSLHFLRYYNFLLEMPEEDYRYSRYFSELSLQDYKASSYPANMVGASCVMLGLIISLNKISNFHEVWTPQLQAASGLLYSDVEELIKNLCFIIIKQIQPSTYRAIYTKYSLNNYAFVSQRIYATEGFKAIIEYFKKEETNKIIITDSSDKENISIN